MSIPSRIDPARPAARTPAAAKAKPPRRPLAVSLAGLIAAAGRRAYRPTALALVMAVVGLAAAGVAMLRPRPQDVTATPAGVVALVNGLPILMSDFRNDLEATTGMPYDDTTPAQRTAMLHSMIDDELMVQRALALDLPEQDTAVRTALADGVNSQVGATFTDTAPSEEALKAYFAANIEKYSTGGSMTVTDLVMHIGGFENAAQTVDQALADAQQAVYELRSGASQSFVMQHFGLVESGKVSGEELDFAAKVHLGPKLYAAASALSDGQISEPVADADGVHVMIMQHRVPPVFGDLDSVRNNVYSDYVKAQQDKYKADNLKVLRDNAKIVLAPGYNQ